VRKGLDLPFLGLLACFLLSGLAALLYQTAWTRHFAFVFGTSELAVAAVLAAYMGGLAAGSWIAGRYSMRVRRPVLVYGALELAIAITALAVPVAIHGSTALARALFGSGDAPPSAGGLPLAGFYLLCAFAILLLPTACMGATLPLLARHSVREEREIGSRTGLLYAINTLGAVLGCVLAAFVMLPRLGLRGTVLAGAGVNALVFVLAALLARVAPAAAVAQPAAPRIPRSRRSLILPLVLLSGVASFGYEVLWTRLLAHVLGGSVYGFATMLASFLAGIAIGSAVAARLATGPDRAARGFAVAQVGTAVASLCAFHQLDRLPELALRLGAGGPAAHAGNAVVAALVLLPATLCIGATFPFAVRVLAPSPAHAAPASARVYAWNTVGAIVGAVGTGFVLLPLLGYAGLVLAAVLLNLALAVAAASLARPAARAALAAAAAALVLVVAFPPSAPWKLVTASPLRLDRQAAEPSFFAVGRSATVSVAHEAGGWQMRINGLPEGAVLGAGEFKPSVLERWLGALPSLARPEAREMLVIGLGAGSALEAVARTIERVDVIEIEPRVIEANELLRDRRAVDPLADPRVRLHANDARGALVLTDKRYDAIVSQPSHPWTAGASHLYTREFFQLAADHLTPRGVLVQWIELTFVDEALFRSLVATLLDVFPHVRVYRPVVRTGVLFLASAEPLPVESAAGLAIAASPLELARAGVQTREDVTAALALDEEGARRFAQGAAITTDDVNLLGLRSPAILAQPLGSLGADRILAAHDPLPAVSRDLDRLYLVRRLIAEGWFQRAGTLIGTFADPAEKAAGNGILAVAAGHPSEGMASLRQALRIDPRCDEARAALVRLGRSAILAGDPRTTETVSALSPAGAAVVVGWRLEHAGDWQALAGRDPDHARIAPGDPFFPDAIRLRVAWRLASRDPSHALEAVGLTDRLLPITAEPDDRVLRARASHLAGNDAAALLSLSQALDYTLPPAAQEVAQSVREVLALIPATGETAARRAALERRIGARRPIPGRHE
jgi:spermidine synthase